MHYTNFIEIMAPVFEMEFFDEMVRPTLYRAYYGWMLDYIWPWLLGYPTDRIAVVDTVCMFHPGTDRKAPTSLYVMASAPRGPYEEMEAQSKEWRYSTTLRTTRGYSPGGADVVGTVPLAGSALRARPCQLFSCVQLPGTGRYGEGLTVSKTLAFCLAAAGAALLLPCLWRWSRKHRRRFPRQ